MEDTNGSHTPSSSLGRDRASEDDQWAAQQLAVDGEEVVGKVRLPQYLLLARTLLTAPLGKHTLRMSVCVCVGLHFSRA